MYPIKRLLFFALILTCFSAGALEVGLGAMGLTPHYENFRKRVYYCRQIGDTGIVTNWGGFLRVGGRLWSTTLFKGTDSICSSVTGLFFNRKFMGAKDWDLSFIFGGYEFRKKRWEEYARTVPDGYRAPEPVYIRLGGTTIVPVLALGLTFRLYGNLWFNNVITYAITNHSLELRFSF